MINLSDLLSRFQAEIVRRRQFEQQLEQLTRGSETPEMELRSRLAWTEGEKTAELASIEQEYQSVRSEASRLFTERLTTAEQQHRAAVRDSETAAARATDAIEQQKGESEWVVTSILDDEADDSPVREFERFKASLLKSREEQTAQWIGIDGAVDEEIQHRNWNGPAPNEPDTRLEDLEAAQVRFSEAVGAVKADLKKLQGLFLPKLFLGFRSLALVAAFALAVMLPFLLLVQPSALGIPGGQFEPAWIGVSFGVGIISSGIFCLCLYSLAAMQQSDLLKELQNVRAEAYWAHQYWLKFAKERLEKQQKRFEAEQKKVRQQRSSALNRFQSAHTAKLREIEMAKLAQLREEDARFQAEMLQLTKDRDRQLLQIDQQYHRRIEQATRQWDSQIAEVAEQLRTYSSDRLRRQTELWSQLKQGWDRSCQSLDVGVAEADAENRAWFAPWTQLAAGEWMSPVEIPPALRLGEIPVDLGDWPDAVPGDVRLAPRRTQFTLPCLAAFPQQTSMLFKSPTPEARQTAVRTLQSLMLRLLTLVPPGKLRFTMIDPVSLGESFSGFMHLADFDELLVTNRIWTEPGQIEARLADLTEHMENVFQKYLRNEFQTIEEYNISAGEVAEPYHILVISDFPAKFSEIAARRLVSIINSGPRCGVYTLLNCDPTKQLPNNFEFKDIMSAMTCLEWRGDGFHALIPELERFPITVDPPPPSEQFTEIVRMVGAASKDARRVEVSFERIAPEMKDIWQGDSRSEIVVPLGRAGATKLQMLKLGKGTSQHMLVAGKTGSGKSTFLHIVITNLALHYSPDEINFYLIDFKKGVEFKNYATMKLPHAKVIAVESDREFGVSALQHLDDVLQKRGELFRKHGVQDIAGYRNATGQAMPRILLIIDEFQEFFIEDDKLSQTASLLLDRLVRQGRAFGIHVILGSQTLGGAYSLARSTMGQIAVRVALQCSEADAHLILSEENTAARLLNRPGEAIYNDANGMLEGNHPFQIAWLSDSQRDVYLQQIQERLMRRGIESSPAIVFEGNVPSDVTCNESLSELIDEFSGRAAPLTSPTVWLGDAVEIAPPTAITFRHESGKNLLILGQDGDAALGIMSSAMVTLAASSAASAAKPMLYLFDGSHPGSPEAELWETVCRTLPVGIKFVAAHDIAETLAELAAEQGRREERNERQAAPIFLFVHHLARFRDLRKGEDDFGMGSFGSSSASKPVEPGKLFADLLAKGPEYGIHCLLWCDSYNNLDRWLSRQSLRELELRIALQMNNADSSNFIDSPAASRLGTHRALLYREETGTTEKFRPYGPPPTDWLETVSHRLQSGAGADIATSIEEFSIL